MILIVQKTCHGSAVGRSHLTAESLSQSHASPSTICGGQIGIGIGYLRVVRFPPLSIIPPLPMLILILIFFLLVGQAGNPGKIKTKQFFFSHIEKY